MMSKSIKAGLVFAVVSLSLMIFSCSQSKTVEDKRLPLNKITLFDAKDEVILTFSGEQKRLAIENIIQNKKVMLKKILPLFKTKLVIESEEEEQKWWIAKPNYIKSMNKSDPRIYEIDPEFNLFETLEKNAAK